MKVTSVRTTPVLAPLARPIRTASGTIARFPLVLIDLDTDAGVTGRSYAQSYLPEMLPALRESVAAMASMLAGQPLVPRDLQVALQRRCRLLGLKGLAGMALGGLDMAVWDAWARARGEPLARALGGDLRPLKAYNSVGLYDEHTVTAIAEETLERGFAGLKVKLGFPSLEQDRAVVRAARRALGADFPLMVDYNQSLSVDEAMRRCTALDDEGLEWIEEPVLADDYAGCARIAAAVRTPIQIGENFHGPAEMQAAIAAGAMDRVMPDPQFIHGVTGWLEAATLAKQAGIPMSSHIFVEASAHLLCVTPTADWLEVLDAAGGIRRTPLTLKDGCVTPWDSPGLGLEWLDEAVAAHRAD